MIIKFTSVEEFIEELRKEFKPGKPIPKPTVLRLTNQYRPSSMSPNIETMLVLDTVVNLRGEVIRFERFVGQLWRVREDQDRNVFDLAAQIHTRIEALCQELGIEVRAGVYEPEVERS